jgi:hypothetical protein
MDATIMYDEVATLVGVNILLLNLHPNFKQMRVLRRHFKWPLQCLPCSHSTFHEWKGMAKARELYAFLTPNAFWLPNNPGNAAVYPCLTLAGQPVDNTSLMQTERATIDMHFAREKHYFMSMRNIVRACFTALDASVNGAFKVSNNPAIQGWHAGMQVIDILGQLSMIYGQPTPAILETNDTLFCSPNLAANAHEVLFHRIKESAHTTLLGCNPYTGWQLVTNAICLLLTTGLYTRPFKDWDRLALGAQTWIALWTMI